MKYTDNLNLKKPEQTEFYNVDDFNENADILDAEIQGIKNTFVKSVNGINAGDDGNVDLGIITISQGGTGASTVAGARNALGLGNTTGALPIANGGTGATTAEQARTNLGLGNVATLNTVPIANGGTGATTKAAAQTNLGLNDAITALSISGNKISYTQADGGTGSVTVPTGAGATAYVTETYRNGTNWYRIWSDGWKEQGGRVSINGTVTYLKAFNNTNYTLLALAYGSDTSGYFNMHVTSYSETTFSIGTSYWDSAFWYACGY